MVESSNPFVFYLRKLSKQLERQVQESTASGQEFINSLIKGQLLTSSTNVLWFSTSGRCGHLIGCILV